MMQYWIVDRIENGVAVCETETRSHISIPLHAIQGNVKDGCAITALGDGTFRVDTQLTEQRREANFRLQEKLFGKKQRD